MVAIAACLTVSGAGAGGGAAWARSVAGGGGGGAVTRHIGAAAQRAALAYWTPGRMAAAARVPLPQAAAAQPKVSAPRGIPTATRFYGVSTVGALFSTVGGTRHFCTAATVRSTAGDLVITAAHCVDAAGFVADVEYVPGYHDGRQPYGAWAVRAIIVPAGWHRSHDPDLDFAFLVVGPAGGPRIQARTGGLTVGFTRWYRGTVEVIGYNDTDGTPVRCTAKRFKFRTGQMEFYCHDFRSGTSGGPWIIGYRAKTGTGTVIGVIGGYETGGDYDWASYSAYFGHALRVLFGQAEKQAAALRLHHLRAVHLAERVSQQLEPHAVRVAEVDRRAARLLVGDPRGVELAAQVVVGARCPPPSGLKRRVRSQARTFGMKMSVITDVGVV